MNQVGAATQQHVLAVVHYFACPRMLVRGRSASHIGPPLKQGDAQACIGKGTAGSQASQPATNNRDGFLVRVWTHTIRRTKPRESILSFSQVVKRTRSVSTS